MHEKNFTVIYIVSDRRSGSTLLENILSKSQEVVSVGELAMLRGHILKQGPGERWNWNCSCGEPVTECIFWSKILKKTYQLNPSFNTNIQWNFKSKKLLSAALFPLFFKKNLLTIINNKENKDAGDTVVKIYNEVFKQTGKPFIIDSSKDPLQALAIYKRQRNFSMKIVWLKRDLRAIAVSKNRWKELNEKNQKSLKKILLDVFYFRRISLAASYFLRKDDLIQIEYEDLARGTQKELDKITSKFGMGKYLAPEFMYIEEDHTIGGTPNRFSKRPIVYEESWKDKYQKKKCLYLMGKLLNNL